MARRFPAYLLTPRARRPIAPYALRLRADGDIAVTRNSVVLDIVRNALLARVAVTTDQMRRSPDYIHPYCR